MSSKSSRSWSRWIALGFLVLVGLSRTTPLAAQAQTKSYPVSLELLAPTSSGNKIPTVTLGGWPLVLRMSANEDIGIIRRCVPTSHTRFPVYGETGEIVFEEPDASTGSPTSSLWFTPGRQLSGLENPFPRSPPCIAASVPSLFLLSDAGPGQGGVNLANYVTNVGYELDDITHRTNVVASLTAPNGFVSPSVTVDDCVGPLPLTGCSPHLARIGNETLSTSALVELLNSDNVATLRAFVVSGNNLFRPNPIVIRDLDVDGVIGAKDAELAGFSLLSREVVFQVRTLHQLGEFVYASRSDLDGNGAVDCGCRSAPGGGQLTPVPR